MLRSPSRSNRRARVPPATARLPARASRPHRRFHGRRRPAPRAGDRRLGCVHAVSRACARTSTAPGCTSSLPRRPAARSTSRRRRTATTARCTRASTFPAIATGLGSGRRWSTGPRPDLVVALWGLWDLFDHEVDGTWLSVGSSAWTAHMQRRLHHALDIVTARHGHMVVLTTPYVFGFSRSRVDALNAIYRTVAARRPGRLTVVDIQPAMDLSIPTLGRRALCRARGRLARPRRRSRDRPHRPAPRCAARELTSS